MVYEIGVRKALLSDISGPPPSRECVALIFLPARNGSGAPGTKLLGVVAFYIYFIMSAVPLSINVSMPNAPAFNF